MKNPMIRIHNLETDEIIDREMTADEFAQFEADVAKTQAELQAEATKAAEKAALLAKLGIDEDEVKLLLS